MYGPPRSLLQATCSFFVSPFFSEMSPAAPGLIAKIGWIGRLPLDDERQVRASRTGVGTVTSDFLASRHSSLPVAGS